MTDAILIVPMKDSMETARETILSIRAHNKDRRLIVYNDLSSKETERELHRLQKEYSFELINLADLTEAPSPNYDVILADIQQKALENKSHFIVVESDVLVRENTIDSLIDFANTKEKIGLVGAITVDENGQVNYPYEKFKKGKKEPLFTNRSLSFCCTLLSLPFLRSFPFKDLNHEKDWYDTTISKKAVELGFHNVIMKNLPVWHRPHSSRPWKQLKYSNPLKYYFNKLTKGRDKI